MGNSSSVEDLKKESEQLKLEIAKMEEGNQQLEESRLNDQLKAMKDDVEAQIPVIQTNVISEARTDSLAFILRYKDLKDTEAVKKNANSLFDKSPARQFLVDAAVNLVSAMTSTKELQQIEGWRSVTKCCKC